MSKRIKLMTTSFEHTPLTSPREDVIGEVTYAKEWARLACTLKECNDEEMTVFESCLLDTPFRPNQRHATVAATFMKWLGTNAGQSFLASARHLISTGAFFSEEDAYTSAWALVNQRQPSINFGIRRIESLLSLPENFKENNVGLGWCLSERPQISFEDIEVIDTMVSFLASDYGKSFLSNCDKIAKAFQEEQLTTFRKERGQL